MTDAAADRKDTLDSRQAQQADDMSPLPGEPGIPQVGGMQRASVSRKGLVAAVLFVVSVVTVGGYAAYRALGGDRKVEAGPSRLARDKPAAAATEPKRLELPPPSTAASTPFPGVKVPAIVPTAEEAEPIGVRRTGQGPSGAPSSGGPRPTAPEDAPVMLVSSRPAAATPAHGGAARQPLGIDADRGADAGSDASSDPRSALTATARNLQDYQQQLHGLLETLTKTAGQSLGSSPARSLPPLPAGIGQAAAPLPGAATTTTGALFGGQLPASATPRATATLLGDRSLTLPKGTAFTCALKTKVVSATSGMVGCLVQRNVFSDDGRVLLIERGSHIDGEYRIVSLRPGTVRIPVLWTRIRTPLGVVVDIDSPGTGPLGESGIDGHVDNRWMERIGAAMLLSLIDDSVKLIIQNQSRDSDGQGDTIVLPSTTANSSKLAEKVLDSTINIPPLIYQNQGGIVGIYVARDVDFSSVYELKATER